MEVIKARDSRNPVNIKLGKIQRQPYQDITVKLVKLKHRIKVLKADRGGKKLFFKGAAGRLTADFSIERLGTRT